MLLPFGVGKKYICPSQWILRIGDTYAAYKISKR